jgi:hypothetical protein
VIGSGAPARTAPPARFVNRTVVVKTAPPPAPATFERQQVAIQQNGGRPLAVSQIRQIETTQQGPARNSVRVAPVARTVTPIQPGNNTRFQQQPNQQINRPGTPGATVNTTPNNRPPVTNAPVNQPPVNNGNNPANNNVRTYNNGRSPNTQPVYQNNPQLEQKHDQQLEQLRTRQDLERQKLEQQQVQQQQKIQQNNINQEKAQQIQQNQQRQLQQLEQKHDVQQQKLETRQNQEHVHAATAPPAKNEKTEKPKNDKPH